MVARAKLAFQRQTCSVDQPRAMLDLPERRPRSLSATVPQSPTGELTQEEVFGQQLYIKAELEVNRRRIETVTCTYSIAGNFCMAQNFTVFVIDWLCENKSHKNVTEAPSIDLKAWVATLQNFTPVEISFYNNPC